MNKASDEFEIMISRIHELLESEDAIVEWNERIPDPDNPGQGRQVDVLVSKNDLKTLIECRLHKKPQDVKWIEELMGRRTSLEADTIVAVSSSGLTSGAIKKANKYGVILRDINQLIDEEITSWARSIAISLLYYRYEDFKLSFFFDFQDIENLNVNQIKKELENYVGFRSLFTAQLNILEEKKLILEENRNKRVHFRVNFKLEGFQLCSCEVKEVQAEGFAYLEAIQLNIPEILAYGEPGERNTERNVHIQNYNLGETKVIHHSGKVSMTIDLSKMEVPPYWQFRYVDVKSDHENYFDSFEIVHPEKIIMIVDKINLAICGVSS